MENTRQINLWHNKKLWGFISGFIGIIIYVSNLVLFFIVSSNVFVYIYPVLLVLYVAAFTISENVEKEFTEIKKHVFWRTVVAFIVLGSLVASIKISPSNFVPAISLFSAWAIILGLGLVFKNKLLMTFPTLKYLYHDNPDAEREKWFNKVKGGSIAGPLIFCFFILLVLLYLISIMNIDSLF